ncbi:hypothetical protein J4526_09245 [Desulfurococcaceae archaeon MEX13E-LK6-19]|nr:hypothetical protein J4526_09245 [Desulfurococcaceae archaeon MEX13E-LK6-19]
MGKPYKLTFMPLIKARIPYDKFIVEEIVEYIASLDPPIYFPPLFSNIKEVYFNQLVEQKVLLYRNEQYVLPQNISRYITRRIDIDIPEYREAALLLKELGVEYKGVIVPGIFYTLSSVNIEDNIHNSIDKIVHIIAKIINNLSDIGYNVSLLYEEKLDSQTGFQENKLSLGIICEAYNNLVSLINTSINGVLFCDRTPPLYITAILDTKIDFLVFNPLLYSKNELETLSSYFIESNITKNVILSLIEYDKPIGTYIDKIIFSLELLKKQIFALTNTCRVWSFIKDYNSLINVLNTLRENYDDIISIVSRTRIFKR